MKLSLKIEAASASEVIKLLEEIGYDKSFLIEQVIALPDYLSYKNKKIEEMVTDSFPPQLNPEPEDYAHARIDQTKNYEDNEFEHAVEWITHSENKISLEWSR
jgi:hypothetical protein